MAKKPNMNDFLKAMGRLQEEDYITADEFYKMFNAVLDAVRKAKVNNTGAISDINKEAEKSAKKLEKHFVDLLKAVDTRMKKVENGKDGKDGKTPISGVDYPDYKEIRDFIKKEVSLEMPEIKDCKEEITVDYIKEELEKLEGHDRLKFTAIDGLQDEIETLFRKLEAGSNKSPKFVHGGVNVSGATTTGGLSSPLTTKGDVWGYSSTNARVPVGANGTVFTADSSETLGVKWAVPAGGGDVAKVGTPVDGQIGVWTGDGTIEGDSAFTFDTSTDSLVVGASGKFKFGAVTILDDTTGTTTLSNIDAIDATTETTLEAAIDSLTNLTAVGTIGTGTWEATDVAVAHGGTGASTAADAIHNLVDNTSLTAATVAGTDKVLIQDTDGSNVLKTVTAQSIADLYVETGTGNVSKVGTPVDNQVGVWTGDGTIEGDAGFTFDGGLNVTVADAENKVGLTITQNDATNDPNAVKITNVGDGYDLALENTRAGALGSFMEFYHNSASPAANDYIGGDDYYGNNSTPTKLLYAYYNAKIVSPTASSETALLEFNTILNGARTTRMTVGDNINGVGVGASTAAGVVSSRGNQDLILQTGNATTGNITIVDGASGDIQVNPNGTGSLVVDGDVKPSANDGGALGTTALQFSDLFLAEGGVINWDNGDATLTQASNMVTLAGADLTVPNITVSDAGAITLGENTSIDLDGVLSADGKYSGTCISGTAGAALAFGDVVYLAAADSRWELTDASAVGTAGTILVGICVLAATGDGEATKVLLHGTIRADTAFPTFTVSAPIYISETAGDLTQTAPTTADAVVRVVGYGLTGDSMYFSPSPDHITHVGS